MRIFEKKGELFFGLMFDGIRQVLVIFIKRPDGLYFHRHFFKCLINSSAS